jgi:WD40 repeat protein
MVKGNPRDESEFVTVGKFHALFWHFDGVTLRNKRAIFAGSSSTSAASSSATKSRGGGADANSPVSFYSIAFSERGYACLGSSDGSILVFVNGKCAKTFAGVHRGKLLSLEWYRGGFVSGGSDGRVHVLDKKMVSDCGPAPEHQDGTGRVGLGCAGRDGLWHRAQFGHLRSSHICLLFTCASYDDCRCYPAVLPSFRTW